MHAYIDHLSRMIPVSEKLKSVLTSRLVLVRVKKGDHLHRPGEICTQTYWVGQGLIRTYYIKDGKEVTDTFAAEGDSITSVKSFMTNTPGQGFLQAVEDSQLYALSQSDLMSLFEEFPEMERFGRITMSVYYVQLANRMESWQFTSAKEKYQHFCETHGKLLNRLPLGMVASYLGISQETLSRVRAQF